MNIVDVDCHVSVRFGHRKREERHFSVLVEKPKHKDLKFELLEGLGIRVWNHEDDVIIPFPNITAFRTADPAAEIVEPTEADKEVLGIEDDAEEEESPKIGFKIKS